MRHPLKYGVLSALLLIVLITLVYRITRPEAIGVDLYTLTKGPVNATVANTRVGTVKACKRSYLAPGTGGEVIGLNVREGDQVEQGQILLEVWNANLKARIGLLLAEIKSRQATAEQACQSAAGASRAANRLIRLQAHKNVVSEEVVDLAVTKAAAEKAACRSARAAIDISQANLKITQANLERTRIRAPFAGTVAEVNAELGEYITPSPPGIPTLPAIDLLNSHCLYISAPIDEVDAPKIQLGMPTCVLLDAFSKKRCSAKITRIAPYVQEKEKQARTVEVEVRFNKEKDLQGLLPGYSADIEVTLASKKHVLRVPAEAVLENNRVLVFQSDGLLVERSFQSGLSNWNFIEVASGLKEGEKIVLSVDREGVTAGIYATAENDDSHHSDD